MEKTGSRKKTEKGEPMRSKVNRKVCVLKPGEELVSGEKSAQWTVLNADRSSKMRTDYWISNVSHDLGKSSTTSSRTVCFVHHGIFST